jgi:hypothetical protein
MLLPIGSLQLLPVLALIAIRKKRLMVVAAGAGEI